MTTGLLKNVNNMTSTTYKGQIACFQRSTFVKRCRCSLNECREKKLAFTKLLTLAREWNRDMSIRRKQEILTFQFAAIAATLYIPALCSLHKKSTYWFYTLVTSQHNQNENGILNCVGILLLNFWCLYWWTQNPLSGLFCAFHTNNKIHNWKFNIFFSFSLVCIFHSAKFLLQCI